MKQICISISKQCLELWQKKQCLASFPISTASKGVGMEEGSYQTPIGRFFIAEKHGAFAPINTIFKARKPIGIWQPKKNNKSEDDLVLTRILWLAGSEEKNKNTKQRYIYIHGTNHENMIGTPCSCGCIRMKNADILKLYNQVDIKTAVVILN